LLAGSDDERVEELSLEAAGARGQMRTYRQVAVLGFLCSFEPSSFAHGEILAANLRWLTGLPPSSAGSPMGFAADPVAMIGIALGFSNAADEVRSLGAAWVGPVVAKSYHSPGLDSFSKCLWSVVQRTAGSDPELPIPEARDAADVRVALRSKGLLPVSETDMDDEMEALRSLGTAADHEHSPVRAAFRVAAYRWISRSAPVIVPSRATLDDVLSLLHGVQFALKRWTWEERPRTRGGTARQWHVDNEYHVQSLLWAVLAPVFPDLTDEEYTVQVGSKNPRSDLAIPSLRLIVEAKFMRPGDSPNDIIEQIAQDASLYLADGSRYSHLIAFVWDDAARSQWHGEMTRSLQQINGVSGAVIVSRPGDWQ
jgi:hypothetical protein